jgi:ornithine--oxo-acid transaminase
MSKTESFIQQEAQFGAHNYKPLPVVLAKGEGVWVDDVEGNRYLDMLSAYSALNFGHRHPALLEAMQQQMEQITLTSRAFYNDQLGPWCEELTSFCGMERALPMNSGAEAVETALKVARKWGYVSKQVPRHQAEIIVAESNFHGRTISIISFSTESFYKDDFGPFVPGFKAVPYGDADALEAAITPTTVAVLLEPIQGESGINMPPTGYLQRTRELCDQHNVLLMLDEIQVGLGRTGKHFCFEHEGIRPDVLILGKALGGGLIPISAVVADDDVLGLLRPGEHGSTFGGNPLACAVSREALRLLREENLAEHAAKMGEKFIAELRAMNSPFVKEVRGRGLLIGVELKHELGGARPFCEALQAQGMLCKETHTHVIRFAPPLVINEEELAWAIERIRRVLGQPSDQVTPQHTAQDKTATA